MIPLRESASEKAEMVSQLLFGEPYRVLEENGQWIKVATCDCDYEGWMSAKHFNLLHEKDVETYLNSEKYLLKELLLFIRDFETNITFPIFIGSSFPYPKEDLLILGDSIFIISLPEEKSMKQPAQLSREQFDLLRFASSYLEAPYLWGGRTPAGIDCSGLVQLVFKNSGFSLPRDASQQVLCGQTVDFIHEAKIGDVAFFENEEGEIIHVGIVSGEGKIIHASGKVRIDMLDSTGIYNKKQERYTHRLRVVKRLLPE